MRTTQLHYWSLPWHQFENQETTDYNRNKFTANPTILALAVAREQKSATSKENPRGRRRRKLSGGDPGRRRTGAALRRAGWTAAEVPRLAGLPN